MRRAARTDHCAGKRRAFTLAETAFSTVIVGMVLLISLRTVAVSVAHQNRAGSSVEATFLAEDLLAEITATKYEEPSSSVKFGPE